MDDDIRPLAEAIAQACKRHCREEVLERLKKNPAAAAAYIATIIDMDLEKILRRPRP